MLFPEFVMKANITRRLEAIGGTHVVIVHRKGPDHCKPLLAPYLSAAS